MSNKVWRRVKLRVTGQAKNCNRNMGNFNAKTKDIQNKTQLNNNTQVVSEK